MSKFKEFAKWYFYVDFKDVTNYVAFVMAAILLWWGFKTMFSSFGF